MEEKLERLHQLEEEMAGLARKIQAHEETKKSPSDQNHPPSSDSIRIDAQSQRHCNGSIHVPNGVVHSPK